MRISLLLGVSLLAQNPTLRPVPLSELKPLLDFEAGPAGGAPSGWNVTKGNALVDGKIAHRGRFSVRLEGDSSITIMAPVTFAGEVLTLRGFVKTEGVTGLAGLWLRADSNSGNSVGYEDMRSVLRGDTDWKQYSVEFPLAANATHMYFGVVSRGGTVWADDLEVLIDGRPVWEAPLKAGVKTWGQAFSLPPPFQAASRIVEKWRIFRHSSTRHAGQKPGGSLKGWPHFGLHAHSASVR